MKLSIRLHLITAFLLLALPLIFAGSASAKYMSDGAVPDGAGGWKLPSDGICVVGLHQDGTIDVADNIKTKRDCLYLTTGTMNGGISFDLRGMTTSAACGTAGATGNDGAKHAWATSGCWASDGTAISLKNLDRTLQMCTAKGGTWVTTGKCTPYGWQYRGQDASGTPLAFGTKGTDASANAGFCYTSMRTGIAVGSCPSTSTNSSTAFGYSVSGTNCLYAYGIYGPVNANLTKANGQTYAAAGATVDLSTLTTMGDCLANGASWVNWMPLNATATIGTITTAATFDLTRQAPSADDGCLHCHSYAAQANGPAERFKCSYLKHGHPNMLRKVTAGQSWAGCDGTPYTTDGTNTFDWVNGKIIVGGVAKDLYYIYGDWMIANPSAVYNGGGSYTCASCHSAGYSDTTNPGVQSIGTPGYVGVQPAAHAGVSITGTWDLDGIGCGRCHNATVPSVTATQIAGSRFPTTAPTGGGMGALAAGVGRNNLCFGCHKSIAKLWPAQGGSSSGTTQYDPTLIPTGVSHGAAAGRDFNGHVIGNSFFNSVHARYAGAQSGNGSIKLNSLGKNDLYDPTGTGVATEYGSIFKGYACFQSTTSASPAKTWIDSEGNIEEIKDKAKCESLYGAGTWRKDTGSTTTGQAGYQGTCSTCHDVHNSLFVAEEKEPAKRKQCENCHVDNSTIGATDALAPQVVVANINHPTRTDTPFDTAKYESACEVCHMAMQAVENGNQIAAPAHLWRINTSATYNTFPTTGQFYGGTCSVHTGAVQNSPYLPVVYLSDISSSNCTAASGTWTPVTKDRNAQVSPETYSTGTYANAVWVDLDLACGQCHTSGGTAFAATKAQLAAAASGMHSGGGSTSNSDCLACHSTGVGGAPIITPGTNHHGVHSDCIGCHTDGHNSTVPNKHSNTFCLTCHTNTGSHGNHHSVPAVTAECVSCHTIPGVTVPPMTTRDQVVAGCTSCHTDIIASGTGDNHHRGHAPSDPPLTGNACQGCHSDNGGKLTTQVSTDKGLLGNEFQDAGPEGTITATSKLCVVCHSEIDHGHGNFIQSGPNQNHHKGNCATCHHAGLANCTDGAPGAGVTTPSPATIVNCTTACHTRITTEYRHSSVTCETCHEHPGAGVLPLNIQDACGQCHGGGINSTSNPPLEGVPYITGDALESVAYIMHTGGTSITVNVTYSTDAPIPGTTVKLLKRTASGWVQILFGMTDSSGRMRFNDLTMNKKYKVVVVNSNVDFNGAVTGKQGKVAFGNTDPKTVPIKLISSATINVQQGTPATNGTKGWNGDNGSLPTINITTP